MGWICISKFDSDECYKRISAQCRIIIGCKNNDKSKRWNFALGIFSIFLGLTSTHCSKANSSPFPSQVAVKRRTSARTRNHTHWRRQRRVLAMSFCPSPMGTGPIASSQARQLPAHWKVGPDIGRWRSAAKGCATKLWPVLTSRDAWCIRPCVRKLVSFFVLQLFKKGSVLVDFASKLKIKPKKSSRPNSLYP